MKNKKVCILDYGSGNVASVFNILNYLNYEAEVSNEESSIKDASHITLPGVGAFGKAMKKIKQKIPLHILELEVHNKKNDSLVFA